MREGERKDKGKQDENKYAFPNIAEFLKTLETDKEEDLTIKWTDFLQGVTKYLEDKEGAGSTDDLLIQVLKEQQSHFNFDELSKGIENALDNNLLTAYKENEEIAKNLLAVLKQQLLLSNIIPKNKYLSYKAKDFFYFKNKFETLFHEKKDKENNNLAIEEIVKEPKVQEELLNRAKQLTEVLLDEKLSLNQTTTDVIKALRDSYKGKLNKNYLKRFEEVESADKNAALQKRLETLISKDHFTKYTKFFDFYKRNRHVFSECGKQIENLKIEEKNLKDDVSFQKELLDRIERLSEMIRVAVKVKTKAEGRRSRVKKDVSNFIRDAKILRGIYAKTLAKVFPENSIPVSINGLEEKLKKDDCNKKIKGRTFENTINEFRNNDHDSFIVFGEIIKENTLGGNVLNLSGNDGEALKQKIGDSVTEEAFEKIEKYSKKIDNFVYETILHQEKNLDSEKRKFSSKVEITSNEKNQVFLNYTITEPTLIPGTVKVRLELMPDKSSEAIKLVSVQASNKTLKNMIENRDFEYNEEAELKNLRKIEEENIKDNFDQLLNDRDNGIVVYDFLVKDTPTFKYSNATKQQADGTKIKVVNDLRDPNSLEDWKKEVKKFIEKFPEFERQAESEVKEICRGLEIMDEVGGKNFNKSRGGLRKMLELLKQDAGFQIGHTPSDSLSLQSHINNKSWLSILLQLQKVARQHSTGFRNFWWGFTRDQRIDEFYKDIAHINISGASVNAVHKLFISKKKDESLDVGGGDDREILEKEEEKEKEEKKKKNKEKEKEKEVVVEKPDEELVEVRKPKQAKKEEGKLEEIRLEPHINIPIDRVFGKNMGVVSYIENFCKNVKKGTEVNKDHVIILYEAKMEKENPKEEVKHQFGATFLRDFISPLRQKKLKIAGLEFSEKELEELKKDLREGVKSQSKIVEQFEDNIKEKGFKPESFEKLIFIDASVTDVVMAIFGANLHAILNEDLSAHKIKAKDGCLYPINRLENTLKIQKQGGGCWLSEISIGLDGKDDYVEYAVQNPTFRTGLIGQSDGVGGYTETEQIMGSATVRFKLVKHGEGMGLKLASVKVSNSVLQKMVTKKLGEFHIDEDAVDLAQREDKSSRDVQALKDQNKNLQKHLSEARKEISNTRSEVSALREDIKALSDLLQKQHRKVELVLSQTALKAAGNVREDNVVKNRKSKRRLTRKKSELTQNPNGFLYHKKNNDSEVINPKKITRGENKSLRK